MRGLRLVTYLLGCTAILIGFCLLVAGLHMLASGQ